MEKPTNLTEDHLDYLDELRASSVTNMFGARPYLLEEFPELEKREAGTIVTYWMKTFGERQKEMDRLYEGG